MMKAFPRANGPQDHKQADGNASAQLAQFPPGSIFPPPSYGHFTPLPEKSDYPADEEWQWKEDIQAWADCHPWD
ncbi:hypothetical protein O181_119308 [Austropuccinia psidii MF-1]|uniref:Uncharacterized protein n=1 Tax=Austropuccinia psidii MF-1 TaxID=1389203 RepID=A0A9Q3KDV4_9BASI|nr:hypothetical protein [Austropuccinia psidii MF-1]